ncbi:MAG: paraquat-inducible protein A [Gammaproteobacteria bacterium]|nr:paraquat-inducible protein A [Gammaproteobacteria bacterium]
MLRRALPRVVVWLGSLGFYALAVLLSVQLLDQARGLEETERTLAALSSPEEITATRVDELLASVTFGLYKGKNNPELIARLLDQSRLQRENLENLSVALGAACVLFLSLWFLYAMQDKTRLRRWQLLHLHGCALVCLGVGLAAPMLTMVAHRDLPLLGEVVLQYDSKSILTTVGKLFEHGNQLVAALLGLFSVAIPILKLLGGFTILALGEGLIARRVVAFIKLIGRWSMTDVFVVAILLAFLAGGASDLTQASLGAGLYFFAAYGLLSIFSGHALLVWLEQRVPLVQPAMERT